MKRNLLSTIAAALLAAGWVSGMTPRALAQDALPDVQQQATAEQEGVETLTRGPLHEAFAETVTNDPTPGIVVAKEPPAPIEELPPEYKPAGDAAIWIPGYFAWDDERDDFIWVSGVYRIPPADQRWVPGHWQQVDTGWQWISGFWVSASAQELVYRNPPPASLENGPSSPAPGDDYFYAPGYWSYGSSGYRWQAGYWYPCYNDYLWIPPRYIWTPRGCIFANGYWDGRLGARGYCFAPIYVNRSYYGRAGWSYRPSVVLNVNVLFNHLFVRPNYHHYMFGNYYGSQYARWNIQPAYRYHQSRGGYDPLMSYYSAYYGRQGQDFMRWSRDWHDRIDRDATKRPPRDWQEMVARNKNGQRSPDLGSAQGAIAQQLGDVVKSNSRDMKFVKLDERQREALQNRTNEVRQFTQERGKLEKLADNAERVRPVQPGNRPGTEVKADAKVHGQFKLPPSLETRLSQAGKDDPSRGPQRDVPPPAQPDRQGVREDLRKLPMDGGRTRPDVPRERPNVLRGRDDVRPPNAARPDVKLPEVKPPMGDRPPRERINPEPKRPEVKVPEVKPPMNIKPPMEVKPPRVETPRVPNQPQRPGGTPGNRANVEPRGDREVKVNREPVPRLDTKRPEPKINRDIPPMRPPGESAPRIQEAPPRVERPQPAPRVERPQPAPRVERPQPPPRVERPQPAPRVERPQPPPRPERPQSRPERPKEAKPEKGDKPRGKDK